MLIKIIKNQEGVTLFLSLLIMSTVVAVAIGLTVLIINQYEFTANVDRAIVAFYAAETGLEANLKLVKDNRNSSNVKLSEIINNAAEKSGIITVPNESVNLGRWDVTRNSSEKYALSHLKMNEKITIDLFNPDDLTGGGGVKSIKINWRDNCLGQGTSVIPGSGWLKISYVSLTKSGGFDPDNTSVTKTNPYEDIFSCGLSDNACAEKTVSVFNPDNYYRVVITPLYCDVDYLKVTAYTAAVTVKDISNLVSIKSTGTYATSKIALSASVPWILPSSGIFDFVLFSEETIEKK